VDFAQLRYSRWRSAGRMRRTKRWGRVSYLMRRLRRASSASRLHAMRGRVLGNLMSAFHVWKKNGKQTDQR
jgi:hypothetical protein